jgi:hypothetical protein
VARKRDIKDVEAVARRFGMDPETRRDFGDYLEDCKRAGDVGTRNDRGDFTRDEMVGKAREFLGEGRNP